jgi:hypothetical protein
MFLYGSLIISLRWQIRCGAVEIFNLTVEFIHFIQNKSLEIYITSVSLTIQLIFFLRIFTCSMVKHTESNLFLFASGHRYTCIFYKTSISHSLATHTSYHHNDIEKLKMFSVFCHVLLWLSENQTGIEKLLCLVNCVITDKERSTLLKQI